MRNNFNIDRYLDEAEERFSGFYGDDYDDFSLWKERVEYVDLSNASPETPTSRSLPLFLLGGAFYPQGTTYLNVFEMKYRYLSLL